MQLGTWTPSIHPFTAGGAIDEQALRAHFRRLAEAGIGVLVANEGTGESHTFSDAETELVLAVAAEELAGVVPVRGMGRMVRTAAQMIDFVRRTERSGVDGVHIYTVEIGHGMVPSPAEQRAYLFEVLEHTDVPALLSLNMVAGFDYPPDLVGEVLDRFPQVDGLIVNTGRVSYLARVIDAVGDRAAVLVSPPHVLTGLALGAHGLAAPEGNIAPRTCVALTTAYGEGDFPAAHEAYRLVMRLGRLTDDYGKSAVKAAVDALGHAGGDPRLPRLPLTAAEKAAVADRVRALGVAEREAAGGGR